jgi:BolA protein
MGPVETRIKDKLSREFSPSHLEVENESYKHSVPKGSETHFRVVIVSAKFEGQTRIARQRLVNACLADEIKPGGVHALTQKTMTPAEWTAAGGTSGDFQSPDCHGGSKE